MKPPAGEAVRSQFPPRNETQRAAVLEYAREAPLVYGEWQHLKWLYKETERASEPEILGTLIGRLDAAPRPKYFEPALAPRVPANADVRAAVLQGNYAYVAASARLYVIDISNPAAP